MQRVNMAHFVANRCHIPRSPASGALTRGVHAKLPVQPPLPRSASVLHHSCYSPVRFLHPTPIDMCGCSAHHTINIGKHGDTDGASGSERLLGLQEIRYGTACCS